MNKFYHLVPVFILSMHVSQYMEFRFINTYMDLPDPFFKIVLIVESLKAWNMKNREEIKCSGA